MNQQSSGADPSRLDVIDALRGFAIVSIMLVHNLEHFDLDFTVNGLPAWLKSLDKVIWDTVFFLFGGKSYAIFSLLFGVTFFIQFDKRAERGEDFRPRFAWRLLLLLGFGIVNSLFYEGDILSFYAVVGLLLIPVARLRDGAVLAIAFVLILQPFEWGAYFRALADPALQVANPTSWTYFGLSGAYLTGDSISATFIGNLTNGKLAAVHWSWEQGRFCQMLALFMCGMLAGRRALFVASSDSQRFWRRTLIWAAPSFALLYMLKNALGQMLPADAIRQPLSTIIGSWSNLAFMLVLVSGFVLLYQSGALTRMLRVFAPLGRMSLTSYMVQSVLGSTIYYGFGFGLYRYTGATYCLLIGIALAVLQGTFSAWWLRRHRQGPLEALWHRATWIGHQAQARPSMPAATP